ncbi:MAG TPA: ATP-binding protein [Armatimonadota bacterium]|nr:ATP-binding protein [Armatimonadota bacterium]
MTIGSAKLRRLLLINLAVVIVCAVSGKFSQLLAIPPGINATIWLPLGIGLGAILLYGYGVWPGYVVGNVLANIFWAVPGASPVKFVLLILLHTIISSLGLVITVSIIRRYVTPISDAFCRVRNVLVYFIAIILGSLIYPTDGMIVYRLAGYLDWSAFWFDWWSWWLSELFSMVFVAPIFLASQATCARSRRLHLLELIAFLMVLFAISLLGFTALGAGRSFFDFLILPIFLWGAIRIRLIYNSTALFLVTIIVTLGTLHGYGPFATTDTVHTTFTLEAFLAVLALTIYLVYANTAEREDAQRRQEQLAHELDVRVTERTQELDRTNRALRILSSSNQVMLRATDEGELLQQICGIVVEYGGYPLAWIGYAEHDEQCTVRPVAQTGAPPGFLDDLHITWSDTPQGQGVTGTAIRTGEASIIRNVATDPRAAPWRVVGKPLGYISAIALPLAANGQTLGALTIYGNEPSAFTETEVQLLGEMANDCAFGIITLRTRNALRVAETALRKERAFLSTSIDILPLPILYFSADGTVIRTNRACVELAGTTDMQHWMQTVQLLTIDTRQPFRDEERPSMRALQGQTVVNFETLLRLPDGRDVPVLVNAGPIELNHVPEAAIVAFQDITKLKEADRAKNQFLMVLSHELKTPLTSIIGWAQLGQSMPEQTEEAFTVILRNAYQQRAVLADLLDVSRIITGHFAITPADTELRELAHQVVESLSQDARARQLQLIEEPSPVPLPLRADPSRITQAISNLLDNAIKFTQPGGTIRVRTFPRDHDAVLEVQDTGRGIAPEHLAHLFRPFMQIQRDERIGGLGLGLSLVRGIVEAHGGHIEATSPGLDKGSTFTIVLPLRNA